MFNLNDFHYYIPLNEYYVDVDMVGNHPLGNIDPAKCRQEGIARFSNTGDNYDVFSVEQKIVSGWNPTTTKYVWVNFILIPKKHSIKLDMEITGNSNSSIYAKSLISTDFGQPVECHHTIGLNDFYKYITAGGNITNKRIVGDFKFAAIRRSNTRFVSL